MCDTPSQKQQIQTFCCFTTHLNQEPSGEEKALKPLIDEDRKNTEKNTFVLTLSVVLRMYIAIHVSMGTH